MAGGATGQVGVGGSAAGLRSVVGAVSLCLPLARTDPVGLGQGDGVVAAWGAASEAPAEIGDVEGRAARLPGAVTSRCLDPLG